MNYHKVKDSKIIRVGSYQLIMFHCMSNLTVIHATCPVWLGKPHMTSMVSNLFIFTKKKLLLKNTTIGPDQPQKLKGPKQSNNCT